MASRSADGEPTSQSAPWPRKYRPRPWSPTWRPRECARRRSGPTRRRDAGGFGLSTRWSSSRKARHPGRQRGNRWWWPHQRGRSDQAAIERRAQRQVQEPRRPRPAASSLLPDDGRIISISSGCGNVGRLSGMASPRRRSRPSRVSVMRGPRSRRAGPRSNVIQSGSSTPTPTGLTAGRSRVLFRRRRWGATAGGRRSPRASSSWPAGGLLRTGAVPGSTAAMRRLVELRPLAGDSFCCTVRCWRATRPPAPAQAPVRLGPAPTEVAGGADTWEAGINVLRPSAHQPAAFHIWLRDVNARRQAAGAAVKDQLNIRTGRSTRTTVARRPAERAPCEDLATTG